MLFRSVPACVGYIMHDVFMEANERVLVSSLLNNQLLPNTRCVIMYSILKVSYIIVYNNITAGYKCKKLNKWFSFTAM